MTNLFHRLGTSFLNGTSLAPSKTLAIDWRNILCKQYLVVPSWGLLAFNMDSVRDPLPSRHTGSLIEFREWIMITRNMYICKYIYIYTYIYIYVKYSNVYNMCIYVYLYIYIYIDLDLQVVTFAIFFLVIMFRLLRFIR